MGVISHSFFIVDDIILIIGNLIYFNNIIVEFPNLLRQFLL